MRTPPMTYRVGRWSDRYFFSGEQLKKKIQPNPTEGEKEYDRNPLVYAVRLIKTQNNINRIIIAVIVSGQRKVLRSDILPRLCTRYHDQLS